MANWREQKRKALGDIHRTFQLPAVYLTHAEGVPVRVNVRLHQKHAVSEQLLAEWGNGASLLDMTDRIIFEQSEIVEVLQRAYVIFGNSEAYRTGPSRPMRETYLWSEVSEVSKADLDSLLSKIDTTNPAFEGILS